MSRKPAYFEDIRVHAARRWNQLEQDPDLAAPWHQLFKQVQNPRHVLSELLQNADDAGATEASVDICGREFVFTHNGEDFTREHFASLCRFGYSNKRLLHTIGFRGLGFKSTFSLGDEVRLLTPSLAVCFRRERFTEPIWIDSVSHHPKFTQIRVVIKDKQREKEIKKNLDTWLDTPASLLFFRNLRCVRIRSKELHWISHGQGPVPQSEWMALATSPQERVLLIRSDAEEFPAEALNEIRQERMLSQEEDTSFPPCRVEIVMGMEGKLFVVLPTDVMTELPFACNAPFVQDPARVRIKDPETSPTNSWLLKRAGELAATAFLGWLARKDLSTKERALAYGLFPDVDRDEDSLAGSCATIVEEAFEGRIKDHPFLLTESGKLQRWNGCIVVPEILLDVWTHQQVASFFCNDQNSILSRHVDTECREKLIHWECVEELDKSEIICTLESKHLPRPESWRKLLSLWAYVEEEVTSYYSYRSHKDVRIVPVQGKRVLYSWNEVVRISKKKLLSSTEDWEFLAEYLLVLNRNWPRFLAEQRRKADEQQDDALAEEVEKAYAVLEAVHLSDASDVSQVMQQVADRFFAREDCPLADCVRLAQIAASLGASLSDNFQFVTCDGSLTPLDDCVVDLDGDLDKFVPEEWYNGHVLHSAYQKSFQSCTKEQWRDWILSGRSGLAASVPIKQRRCTIWGRDKICTLLKERACEVDPYFRYVTDQFIIEDWDFEREHWDYWRTLAQEDETFWGRLLARIVEQPQTFWSKTTSAKVLQVATTGNTAKITHGPVPPAWIVMFRSLPCLQDTWGKYRQPAELLRRTPETESLLDVEPFVRAELDSEATRPLLKALGVRDTPTGPDRLLERLRALTAANDPPLYEVEKWYRRLDQLASRCSTEEFEEIKEAFAEEKLILSEANEWLRAGEIFLEANEEDVPGAAVVHPSVRHLMLWRKIGVADRPTEDLAIQWLTGLSSGQSLSQEEVRRVRSLLRRYPARVWQDCGHWLNLEGEWRPVVELAYALTMQLLVPWKHLFRPIKQKTADLQMLSADVCQEPPFNQLRNLAECVEERFEDSLYETQAPVKKPWLIALGNGLRRIILDDQDQTQRLRELAGRLASTGWQVTAGIKTQPYIDGTPAGTPRRVDALWKDSLLYVENRPSAKIARAVAQELGHVFGRAEIVDAIKLCYDRSPEFVEEYLEENFELFPVEQVALTEGEESPDLEKSLLIPGDAEGTDVSEAGHHDGAHGNGEEHEPLEADTQDDDGSENVEPVSPGTIPRTRQGRQTPPKPSLMERFANSKGYVKESESSFTHPEDGSCIEKVTRRHSFPWERRSASGKILRCYWVKEHCIERAPLQIDAEVWKLCDEHPDKYSLLLLDLHGSPVEITGRQLQEMRDRGQLTVYPATYRVVYKEDR